MPNTMFSVQLATSSPLDFALGTCLLAVGFVGCVANGINIGTVVWNRKLHNVNNSFIASMMVADLLTSLLAIVAAFHFLLQNSGEFIMDHPVYCKIQGITCILSLAVSNGSSAIIGLNRYIYICHSDVYPRWFTKCKTTFIITLLWAFTVASASLSLTNSQLTGGLDYHKELKYCMLDYMNPFIIYPAYICIVYGVIPSGIALVSYWQIFKAVYQSKQRVGTHNQAEQNATMSKENVKIYKSLLVMFATLLITQIPASVVIIKIFHLVDVPDAVVSMCFHCIMLAATINPIVLGCMNPDFKPTFIKIGSLFHSHSKPESHMAPAVASQQKVQQISHATHKGAS